MAEKLNQLSPKRLGLAAAIVWGLTIFGTTLLSATIGYGTELVKIYASIHPGYSISIAGSFVGLAYAAICGFVGAYVIAWLYNWLEKKI